MSEEIPKPKRADRLAANIAVGGQGPRRWGRIGFLAILSLAALGAGGYFGWRAWERSRAFVFDVRLASAEGLAVGSPVRVGGVEAGEVVTILFAPGPSDPGRLLPVLTVAIGPDFSSALRSDLGARVEKALLFGENALAITPGSPGAPRVTVGQLIDLAPPEGEGGVLDRLSKRVGEFFAGAPDGSTEGDESREQILRLLAEVQEIEGRIDRLENAVRALGRKEQARGMP